VSATCEKSGLKLPAAELSEPEDDVIPEGTRSDESVPTRTPSAERTRKSETSETCAAIRNSILTAQLGEPSRAFVCLP